jgi:hypothetical protein
LANDGLQVPATQLEALRAIPASDMLVNPAELESVLEEPSSEGLVSQAALLWWTLGSLAVTVIAAIWWAASGH